MSDGHWLHQKEVAARCGVSRQALWRWRRRNFGPPFFQFGRRIRYDAQEFEHWLDSQRGGQ